MTNAFADVRYMRYTDIKEGENNNLGKHDIDVHEHWSTEE